jgi:dipeptidyl aminopeptidase/acylaminoacyl peptidase
MNADGTGQTNLTSNSATDERPAWSPDGTKIAFDTDRVGNRQIFVMNSNGTGQTNLSSNAVNDYSPNWSPDGTKITYDQQDTNNEIYSMNANGTGQTNLTNNAANDFRPAWSPDGTKIAFDTLRDGNSEIYTMNADGTVQTRLTNNAATDAAPDWQPLPASCTIKITNGGWIVTDDADQASFGGTAKETSTGAESGQENYLDHGPAEPMNVHSLTITDITCDSTLTKASIFGTATINGAGSHAFQIDVEDNGSPGKGTDHYRMRISDVGYDSGDHVLRAGNVQIH